MLLRCKGADSSSSYHMKLNAVVFDCFFEECYAAVIQKATGFAVVGKNENKVGLTES